MIKKIWILTLFTFLLTPMALASSSEPKQVENEPEQELSLQQDRAALDSLRKDIPEDMRRENDDWAFILKLFDDKKRKPGRIQSQFNKSFNRARKKKQREFKKQRKTFDRAEKSKRKKYLSESKKKRKEFLADNPSKEAKKEFFETERAERKDYFSEQRERRKDFESELKAKRGEFRDFMKDRRRQFTDRMRQFKKEQRELKLMEKKMKKSRYKSQGHNAPNSVVTQKNQQYLDDFSKIPKRGGHKLGPKEDK